MTDPWVLGAAALVVVGSPILAYNRFIWQKNLIRDSWANVDTELRRRYDLIPNLVATVKGYADHERALLGRLLDLRETAIAETGAPDDQARAENELVRTLRRLFALVEDYPELKASQHFVDLQRELTNTEDRIQAARRFYNNNVRDYNRRVQSVPTNIIARLFRFTEARYFEIEAAIRETDAPAVGSA